MSPQEIRDGIEYVRTQLTVINDEAGDQPLNEDQQARWDGGVAYIAEQTPVLERHNAIAEMAEAPAVRTTVNVNLGGDTDAGLRFDATPSEIRDAGMRALEQATGISDDDRESAERTARNVSEGSKAEVYKRFITTGTDQYRSAFAKYVDGMSATFTSDEAQAWTRAASLTDGAGGFAVPFTLDPTIIITNTGVKSAVRQLAREVSITTDAWNGISSAGVTASWDAEAVEVSDDAPTLVQPSIAVHKAQAFVPFSIEIGQDWANIDSDVRNMFSDAKERLEGAAFVTGTGSGQPTGIITALDGGSSEVSPAVAEAFAIADVYGTETELPARYRNDRTAWLLHYGTANAIRQFDTAGGAGMWERIGAGMPPELIGWRAEVDSTMDNSADINAAATADNHVLVLGDWENFVIVDRAGMSVELVPHLFNTANNLPSGQRGLYTFWRTGSDSVNDAAFRVLNVATTA